MKWWNSAHNNHFHVPRHIHVSGQNHSTFLQITQSYHQTIGAWPVSPVRWHCDIVTLWVWMTLDFYSSAAATFLLAVGTFLTDYPPWKELNIPLVTPHFRQFLWKMLSVVLLVHFSSVWCRVPLHHPVSSLNLLVPRLWQYCSIALYAFVLLFYCKGLYGVWLP